MYEIDITIEDFKRTYKKKYNKKDLKYGTGTGTIALSDDGEKEDPEKSKNYATLTFYENPASNRLITVCGSIVLFDGEIPNDECYGSVVTTQCFSRDMADPYGVGLYELMRGNTAKYSYIDSMLAEQVEAEVFPLLFATGTGNGTMQYKKGPNVINQMPAGVKIEKIMTTANLAVGTQYADKQLEMIEQITGVNNIVAGINGAQTATESVLLKEAALNRLMKPRNSLGEAIENDACITFSWFEQDQINERMFTFSNEADVEAFVMANPGYTHKEGTTYSSEEESDEFDENGVPIVEEKKEIEVFSSKNVPLSFDFDEEGMAESDYQDQNVKELGSASISMSRAGVLQKVNELDDASKLGYDKVILKVDTNSMLIPSQELLKQTSMQIFPVVQNTVSIIYGLSKQDQDACVSQLTSLKTFLEEQRQNIYDYIPKDQYDKLLSGQLFQEAQQQMMQQSQMAMGMEGGATQMDGTSVAQPQNPEEMPQVQSPMGAGVDATMNRAAQIG